MFFWCVVDVDVIFIIFVVIVFLIILFMRFRSPTMQLAKGVCCDRFWLYFCWCFTGRVTDDFLV